MKIIVFSDIHGNSYALDEFLLQINKISYDHIIFCGDIFGYYYNQKEVIEKLNKIHDLIWLKGNHDDFFLRAYQNPDIEKDYIEKYGHSYEKIQEKFSADVYTLINNKPSHYILHDNSCEIAFFHGTPNNVIDGRLYPNNEILCASDYTKYDIVVLGHTHFRMMRNVGNTLVMNPGSLGQPRDGKGYSYAVLDTETKNVEFKNITFDESLLYRQIDMYDKELTKLKDVLERRYTY